MGGLTGGRAHRNPNPSIQKCRMEEGKPYTIHHRARLNREESSMATSHLKGGQIQQQEQMEKKKRKERQEASGQDTKPLMLCFSIATGLEERLLIDLKIQDCSLYSDQLH